MPIPSSSLPAVDVPPPTGVPPANINAVPASATPPFQYTTQPGDTWGGLTFSHCILGGFRPNNENLTDELRRQNPAAPEVLVTGTALTASWHHLRTRLVGGSSVYGNWVGPGALDLWLTRPTNVLDLAGKLHDFAYEVNGLSFKDEKRPEMFWSRKAKADRLFFALIEPFQPLPDSVAATIHTIARQIFHADARLFRRDDAFINPLLHMPKDWLVVPYACLAPAETPEPRRVRVTRSSGSHHLPRPMIELHPDYRAPVAGVDTADAWIARLSATLRVDKRASFVDALTEVRALTGAGRATPVTDEDPWRTEMSLDELIG